jgi:STE24 endopeptidase
VVTSRIAAGAAALALLAAVLGALLVTTPRTVVPSGAQAEIARNFTPAEIAREVGFYRQVRPWSLGGMALSLAVTLLLGLTPLGARLITAVARPFGGHWTAQAALGVTVLSLIGLAVTLPLSARSEVVLRRYGLSTQNWAGWWADVAKGWAVSAVLSIAAVLILFGVVRAAPRWWWAWLAAGAAAVTFALSFLYPVLIEPIFNQFSPMPHTALRQELVDMAARDGVPVKDVLVADASRRTTALNAYVSGYGPSRRIVVYDTLLKSAPDAEVKLVVAHELGHAKFGDVLRSTVIGALGAALAVCLLFLAASALGGRLEPRSLALLLAVGAIAGLLTAPVASWASRRTEARADEHALDLTGDPATFVAMQRRLAIQNIADLDPPRILYFFYASHPTTPERIAMARDYAHRHHIELAESPR